MLLQRIVQSDTVHPLHEDGRFTVTCHTIAEHLRKAL